MEPITDQLDLSTGDFDIFHLIVVFVPSFKTALLAGDDMVIIGSKLEFQVFAEDNNVVLFNSLSSLYSISLSDIHRINS